MKRNKKLGTFISMILLVAALAFIFSSCQPTTPVVKETAATEAATEETAAETAAGEKIQVFFANQQTAHPFWNIVKKGVDDGAARYDMEVTMGGPTQPDDAESVRIIEAAIATGQYAAIIIPAIVPEMYTPSINKAVDAGMLVIVICEDAPDSKRRAAVVTSDTLAGKAGGEKMVELTEGKANINIITGISDQPGITRRIEGFMEAIAAYPDMKVTSTDANEGDTALGLSKLQARLVSDPDVNAFFGTMGDAGPNIMSAYPQNKERLDAADIVVFDDVEQTLDGIRQGVIDGTVVQSQYNWGFGAIYQIHRVLQKGLDVSSEISNPPAVIVTKDNVENYAELTMDPKVWLDLEAQE